MNIRRKGAWFGCAGLLGLALFAYVYGPALVLYRVTKREVKDDASLARVPEPVPTNKIAKAAGRAFSFFGVGFQVPWNGEPEVKQWQKVARIQFPEGQFVMLFDPSSRADRIRVLGENGRGLQVERVFGRDAMRSNYALVEAVLKVSPKDISLWMPRVQLVRNCVFLMLKKAELANTETGLFRFQNQTTRGFQKGDPAKSDAVAVDVFDNDDLEYSIIVGRVKDTKGIVSQEDINLILATITAKPVRTQPDNKSEASSPAD